MKIMFHCKLGTLARAALGLIALSAPPAVAASGFPPPSCECEPCRIIDPILIDPVLETLAVTLVPGPAVLVDWETGSETGAFAFRVRSGPALEGPFAPISGLIPADGNPGQGASYSFLDTGVRRGPAPWYQLEAIDASGASAFHPPVPLSNWPVHPRLGGRH